MIKDLRIEFRFGDDLVTIERFMNENDKKEYTTVTCTDVEPSVVVKSIALFDDAWNKAKE